MPKLNRPLRLLIFSYGDFFGGAQQYLVNLFNHLSRDQCRISCVCTHTLQLNAIKARLVHPNDVDFILFQPNQPQTFLRMVLPLTALFASRRPDVVLFNQLESALGGSAVIVAARLARVPRMIGMSHTTVRLRPRTTVEAIFGRILDRMLDGFIVIAQRSIHEVASDRSIPPERIRLIHYGIPLLVRSSPHPQKGDRLTIGTLSRLVPIKSIQTTLCAVALIPESLRPNVHIIGDGPERQQLMQLTHELGLEHRVRFIGWTDTPSAELQQLDIFVLASLSEGVPLSILEAMQCGLPVIATDVGGVSDAVVHGQTGLLVPRQDPHRLAQALIALISNPEQRRLMGMCGKERAETYFSATRMAAETWAYYLHLLGYED